MEAHYGAAGRPARIIRRPVKLFFRAAFFALLCPGTVTILIPWLLLRSGARPLPLGDWRFVGLAPLALGVSALLWCIADFARIGRGTLAPVDPPRALVVQGLYRFVRNPMYVAVFTTLLGEAILFRSWPILSQVAIAMAGVHLFVVLYEEPALRRKFGAEYEEYCRRVRRWLPRAAETKVGGPA